MNFICLFIRLFELLNTRLVPDNILEHGPIVFHVCRRDVQRVTEKVRYGGRQAIGCTQSKGLLESCGCLMSCLRAVAQVMKVIILLRDRYRRASWPWSCFKTLRSMLITVGDVVAVQTPDSSNNT